MSLPMLPHGPAYDEPHVSAQPSTPGETSNTTIESPCGAAIGCAIIPDDTPGPEPLGVRGSIILESWLMGNCRPNHTHLDAQITIVMEVPMAILALHMWAAGIAIFFALSSERS
jgi:hypothetical protein